MKHALTALSLILLTVPLYATQSGTTQTAEKAQFQPMVKKPATVLLITHTSLAKAWQPFADWKTQLGKATKIMTVSEIDKRYKAKTIQEKIRLCVREHIDHKRTRWVILGGDALPNGQGLVPGGHTTYHRQEAQGIPTDIVYISPTNWDADGDGRHGEWQDDAEAITYPDGSVGLGRIPVRTVKDVVAFTEKVIAYESRYPTGKFATQMIYTCTERGAYPKVLNSWDSYVSKAWSGGKVQRFFAHKTPWDESGPGSYPLSSANLVKLINSKTNGKLHIHGHGLLPKWVLERSMFTAKHVRQLRNDGAYPLITTVSCFTGQYDGAEDPSIVEAMIRQAKGGSVAIVAPVRTGKPHFAKRSDFRLMMTEGKLDGTTLTLTRYWSHGLGSEKLTTGEAFMKAKADMAKDGKKSPAYHLCLSEINLLGDPTLDMRSAAPKTPTVQCPKSVKSGSQRIRVVTNQPGSTVCLWQKGQLYKVETSDNKGEVQFLVDVQKQDLTVTVTGSNLNAVTKTIQVAGAQRSSKKRPKKKTFH